MSDLDDLNRDDLPEPARAVADTLDDWLVRHHGVMSSHHNAGSFLRLLAEEGYEVRRIPPPPLEPWEIRAQATGGLRCGCGKPFYTHVCLGCSPDYQTPGPGCVNCRNTGMDQTPCKPAAVDALDEVEAGGDRG